ncbi:MULTISPECIES: very short patch repair endonuclease [Sphingomonadales]|uniref:very short patch repair endonuclease n=1 Tax=Sphingomonadales TaxID=204457 RepID=UPI0032633AC3
MADVMTPAQRSRNMALIRGKDTKPELQLRSLLHAEGFRFRLHHPNLPGRPDIVLPKYRTVIFVNGCFWHRHKGCRFAATPKTRLDFWNEKFKATITRDKEKTAQLTNLGWCVLTVWECELKNNALAIVERVKRQIRETT